MMLPRRSVLVGLLAHALSAVIAVATLMHASSPFSWDPFVLWVAAPYAAFAAAIVIPWGDADRRTRTGCVTALVVLVVTHFFYRGIWGSQSSTVSLLFYYLPMYLLPGGAVLWLLVYLFGPRVWTWLSAGTGKLD